MSTDTFDITAETGYYTPGRRKNQWGAAVAPVATDDASDDYEVGSLWIDTTNDDAYICVDSTTGAAVWERINGGGTLHTDLSVTGAHTIDRADGETHDLTLTGDATFTLAGAITGEATDIRLVLRQDGTGSRTVTWPTITWAGGSAPTLQTAANAVDTIGLLTVDDGVTWFGYFDQTGTSLTPASTVESETTFGIAAAVGSDSEYARQDHTHGTPADPVTAAAVQGVGHYELLMAAGSSPVEPLEDGTGDDWLYVWVNE